MKHQESRIAEAVSSFLQVQYPNILYRFDIADLKLTMGQAVRNKKLNPHRGWCDLFIAEPNGKYSGMFLELKKSKDEVFKKDGNMRKNEHLEEQKEMIERLKAKGYYANWGLGFDDSIKQIREYMKGNL